MLAGMLLGVYLMFFGTSSDMLGRLMTHYVKDQISVAIADPDRRELALQGLAKVNDDISDLNKQLAKDAGQFEKLIKDYDSTPQEFDQQLASAIAKRQRRVDRIWDDRRAMLQHIRADEWRVIMRGARAAAEQGASKKE